LINTAARSPGWTAYGRRRRNLHRGREFAELNRTGGLKTINRRYREQRLAAAAEGRKVPPYQFWLFTEKRRMVVEIAVATAQAGRIGVARATAPMILNRSAGC
jgi:hypothetical protein